MNKFFLGAVLSTLIILGLGVFYFSNSTKKTLEPPSGYEYYWSPTCPHCTNVQEFLVSWEGKDKITLDKKEVGSSQNSNALVKRARSCNIPPADVGVPFLFTPEGRCIVGDKPIIKYLESLSL